MRLFSPLTIEKFTTPESPADQPILRGLGWDIDSPYSSNRGDLFPIGSYGHTGFTGTSLWIDPGSRTLRDPDDEFGASASRQIAHFAAQPRRHHRRGGLRNCRAGA